jgi:hypothetical protein
MRWEESSAAAAAVPANSIAERDVGSRSSKGAENATLSAPSR